MRLSRVFLSLALLAGGVAAVVIFWPGTPVDQEESAQPHPSPVKDHDPEFPEFKDDPESEAQENAQELTDALSADEKKKLANLEHILASRNDSDPALDRDFRELSPAMKAALRDRYHRLPNEDRGSRGTLIFLLGREIASPEDVAFVTEVLNEPPCLSLEDCSRRSQEVDEHAAAVGGMTLVYPQMVAIRSFERFLKKPAIKPDGANGTQEMKTGILEALRKAESYEHPNVARAARQALERSTH